MIKAEWKNLKKQLQEEWESDLKGGGPGGRDIFALICVYDKALTDRDEIIKELEGALRQYEEVDDCLCNEIDADSCFCCDARGALTKLKKWKENP